jgi:hypothetical protein
VRDFLLGGGLVDACDVLRVFELGVEDAREFETVGGGFAGSLNGGGVEALGFVDHCLVKRLPRAPHDRVPLPVHITRIVRIGGLLQNRQMQRFIPHVLGRLIHGALRVPGDILGPVPAALHNLDLDRPWAVHERRIARVDELAAASGSLFAQHIIDKIGC